MNCSMPGFPVLHHLRELAQIHVHLVSDAVQPSHPLSSPSPPAFSLSQHHWENFENNFENKFNFSKKKSLRSTNFMVTCTLKKGSKTTTSSREMPRQNRITVSGLPPSKVLSLNKPIVVKCPLTFQQHSDDSFYNTHTKIHSNFPFLNFSLFWPCLGWNVTSSELSLTLCAIFQPCHFPSQNPCLTIMGTQYISVELFKIFIPTHTKQVNPGCISSSSMDD